MIEQLSPSLISGIYSSVCCNVFLGLQIIVGILSSESSSKGFYSSLTNSSTGETSISDALGDSDMKVSLTKLNAACTPSPKRVSDGNFYTTKLYGYATIYGLSLYLIAIEFESSTKLSLISF